MGFSRYWNCTRPSAMLRMPALAALLALLSHGSPAAALKTQPEGRPWRWPTWPTRPPKRSDTRRSEPEDIRPGAVWLEKSKSAAERAYGLLKQLEPAEKVSMIHGSCMSCPYVGFIPGNERLGIPPLNLHDGPQGFRNEPLASGTSTSWPGAMGMAATWDEDLLHEWGAAMGREFRAKGSNVQLGPGLNLARVPKNGRNFEYLAGEDPYLGYVLSKPVVRGIQEQKVIACGKHWVGNSQEANRMDISEDIDERTLFEMYYPPFEGAIEAGIGAMMCSYNRLNGVHSCENGATLGHLRKDLGFQGFVMSDWGAAHSASLRQGLDMEMPIAQVTSPLALLAQKVPMEDLDASVFRILRTMYELGVMDAPLSTWNSSRFVANVSSPQFDEQARRFGAEATVLLKNENGVLPLPQGKRLALLGFASDNARSLAYGHGSGEVAPSYFVTPLEGIRKAAGEEAQVEFYDGRDVDKAARVARAADYAIVFVGASASEGVDRNRLDLDNGCAVRTVDGKTLQCDGNDEHQNKLVRRASMANPRTVVVASVPGAFTMPWVERVGAVLTNFMPGQQAGNALADVLFGKVNPSAKLPITIPNLEKDLNFASSQYPGERQQSDGFYHSTYSEQLLVGYRYYDAQKIQFKSGFPFGHGLSYTRFVYTDLQIEGRSVTFNVVNNGDVEGREVAQLYLGFPAAAEEPPLQLKGFAKTSLLKPDQSERITLTLRERDTSIWSTTRHAWEHVPGTFTAHVGSSSRDIRLAGALEL